MRKRTLEFLDKRLSWLEWTLTSAHVPRKDPGSHHYFEESFPYLVVRCPDDLRNYKRLCRYAKLHNRYLSQWQDVSGITIN